MRSRYFILALLASSSFVVTAQQPAADAHRAPALTIKDLGTGIVTIDGNWQFHLGDDMRWAAPAYDDSEWEHIKADDTWGAQEHSSYAGFAWYRQHIDISPSIARHQTLAILVPPVDDAYELYWNGEKIGDLGTLPPKAVWYIGHRQSFALPSSSSGTTHGLLAFRVWKAPLSSVDVDTSGGLNAPPVVGDSTLIAAQVGQADFLRMRGTLYGRALSCFFMLIATLSFFAWVRNRGQRLFLWFAVWLLAKVFLFYLSSDRVIEWISATTFANLLLVLHSIVDCSIFLLLLYLFSLQDNRRIRRWTWTAIGANVGFGLADAVVLLPWASAGRGAHRCLYTV
jgi:hypothetical protein